MSIQPLLIAAAALFSIGIYGILVRRNASNGFTFN